MNSIFEGTEELVEAVDNASPNTSHVDAEECEPDYRGRRVSWIGSGYIIRVSVDHVRFMEGNQWNLSHAAGVMEAMENGLCIEVPAARVHRIRASDVKYTEAFEKRGELSYQTNMVRPWRRSEIGSYSAQLIDGNHRAAAAMALGEKFIWVYVGENYRSEVRKKDWE